jgi:hypothetical protein
MAMRNGDCKATTRRMRRALWSKGSTTNAVFHPLVRVNVNEAGSVRVSYDLESKTPDGTVRRAYRTSDDGFTWNAPVEFGAAYSGSEGWSWGTSYDMPVVTNQIVEYGLNVKNAQNANVEMFQVVALVDVRKP